MNTRIFNLIVLDESGSMEVIKQQAIMGVNETVQTIKSAQKEYEDQEHIVSLVTFNSRAVKTVYDKVQAENVAELTEADYCPNCGTPLYDAMGQALNDLRQYVADKDKVLVTIITDGYENASKSPDPSRDYEYRKASYGKHWYNPLHVRHPWSDSRSARYLPYRKAILPALPVL